MEILVTRAIRSDKSTIGNLLVDGVPLCYTLEDRDRGLKQSDSLLTIKAKKLFGITAIPAGRYEVIMNMSNRFKKYMPLLLNVPGFEGVRIHTGNYADNTEGCILVGMEKGKDFIGRSRDAYDALIAKILAVEKSEKIFITIT